MRNAYERLSVKSRLFKTKGQSASTCEKVNCYRSSFLWAIDTRSKHVFL